MFRQAGKSSNLVQEFRPSKSANVYELQYYNDRLITLDVKARDEQCQQN